MFEDNSSSWLQLPLTPFFFPLSHLLWLSQCNPWQWKVTPPLPPSRPPLFKSKFNCLWHHVSLLRATRQPGRDCGVQRASTNPLSLFSLPFSQSLLLFHACRPPHRPTLSSSCIAKVSPPESSSDQLFSTYCSDGSGKTLSPSVLASWLAGTKAGWQDYRLNLAICQRTAG